MFTQTTALIKISKLKKKIRAIQGGTSSSKTISILLLLINLAQSDKEPTLTSIVSESIPHLKRGAMRDFENIMKTHGYWSDKNWNKTDSTYTFETGSRIEFFSTDNGDKLRGARRDRLFINECNNVPLDAFDQLEVRTRSLVYLDWNPTNEFWLYTDVLPHREDVDHIILTYKDNEPLDAEIVKSIESRKNNKGWWRVYGMGLLGEVEGKIYKSWLQIDELPHEARLVSIGMDFGYSNDPTAIIGIYKYNDGYILDEIGFQKGILNKQIADIIKMYLINEGKQAITIADSAEPKSIDEIRLYGVSIMACRKGADSVRQGIQFVQKQSLSVTKRSVNLWKGYSNYLWKTDKTGRILNVPDHNYSDAMDAVRYGFDIIRPNDAEVTMYQRPKPVMNSSQ